MIIIETPELDAYCSSCGAQTALDQIVILYKHSGNGQAFWLCKACQQELFEKLQEAHPDTAH